MSIHTNYRSTGNMSKQPGSFVKELHQNVTTPGNTPHPPRNEEFYKGSKITKNFGYLNPLPQPLPRGERRYCSSPPKVSGHPAPVRSRNEDFYEGARREPDLNRRNRGSYFEDSNLLANAAPARKDHFWMDTD
jgi:hypothetical protein